METETHATSSSRFDSALQEKDNGGIGVAQQVLDREMMWS